MRRNARSDRILFHYNGHGVPRPTDNGEIWVFNRVFFYFNNLISSVYSFEMLLNFLFFSDLHKIYSFVVIWSPTMVGWSLSLCYRLPERWSCTQTLWLFLPKTASWSKFASEFSLLTRIWFTISCAHVDLRYMSILHDAGLLMLLLTLMWYLSRNLLLFSV